VSLLADTSLNRPTPGFVVDPETIPPLTAKKSGFNNIEGLKDLNKKAFGGLLRLLISLAAAR
jgi:hypothetical protein